MKGIVVDFNNKYVIVVDKKGKFIKVKNNGNFVVGHEIDIGLKVINHNFKALSKVVSIAAGLLLFFSVVGAYAYNMPYNYVNLDINPSLEFTVNMFEVVLHAKGLNSDGENLLKGNNYKHLKIDKAVGQFIEAAVCEGFLEESTENAVMITVSGKNYDKLPNIEEHLVNAASITLEHDKVQSEVVTERITLTKRDNAKQLGISPGKLVLIEKLKEENPDIEIEEFKEKPVKDILTSIKQAGKDNSKKQNDQIKATLEKDNGDVVKPGNYNNEAKGNSDAGKKANTDNGIKSKDTLSEDNVQKNSGSKDMTPGDTRSKDTGWQDRELQDRIPKDKESDDTGSKNIVQKDNEPGNREPQDKKPNDKTPNDKTPKDTNIKKFNGNKKDDKDKKNDKFYLEEDKDKHDFQGNQNGKGKKRGN